MDRRKQTSDIISSLTDREYMSYLDRAYKIRDRIDTISLEDVTIDDIIAKLYLKDRDFINNKEG